MVEIMKDVGLKQRVGFQQEGMAGVGVGLGLLKRGEGTDKGAQVWMEVDKEPGQIGIVREGWVGSVGRGRDKAFEQE